MTYNEYISAICKRFGLSVDEISVLLINESVLIPDVNAEVNIERAKRALCNEFASMIPLANVSEGGYSVTWNIDAIKLWYAVTCRELGMTDTLTQPTISNRSNIW